jgi:hypothetical protein
MKTIVKNMQIVVAVFGIILALALVPTTSQGQDQQPVFSRDEVIRGLTYGQWTAAWWQYVLSIPNSQNPLYDGDGQCSITQSGPVFFLVGSYVGTVKRECENIPAKTPILIPIINTECSNVEPAPFFGEMAPDRSACAKILIDGVSKTTLMAKIDGVSVNNLSKFRVQSPDFYFNMPSIDNILFLDGVSAGNSTSDGYWLMLKPLSPGRHVIHVFGECVSGDCAGFSQDIKYILNVN